MLPRSCGGIMVRPSSMPWYRQHRLWLEIFVLLNLGFLGPDIYLAHSVNLFRHWPEYLPLFFSLAASWLLLIGFRWPVVGHIVGAVAILVGVAGLIWHLDS